MGFYEVDEGDIIIGGRSIRDMDKKTVFDRFSYAPQKALVFQDTVRNNITAFNENISDEVVMEAARLSCFDEVLSHKAEGLDYSIAQGGMNLSGGQRKRLTLARALCKDTDIYLLDDPYAALDAVTESTVSKNVKGALYNKTVIMVSSKINAIKDADNILVLDQGCIAGFGKHEQLLESCNAYKEIYDTQCYLDREG